MPESYLAFVREIGFADMDGVDICCDADTPSNLCDDEIDEELRAMLQDRNVEDYYFFAIDCASTRYAFSKDPADKKVYAFSNEAQHQSTYENFEEFLATMLV